MEDTVEPMEVDIDEAESVNQSSSPTPADVSFPLILKYLPTKDLKQLRTVNKHCNHLVSTFPKFQDKVSVHINGHQIPYTTQEVLDATIAHLATTPNQPWQRFKFSNLNLEFVFLGQEKYFDPFVTNHCSNLKSLHLVNCIVRLGRMMELLAFCKVLQELEIRNCSNLFENGMEVANWAAFVPHFKRTLSRIRCFSLEDRGQLSLQPRNLYSWLSMTHIVKLELKSTCLISTLPIDYICKYLTNVQQTLRHLRLLGSRVCELSPANCETLRALDLQTLSLAYFRLLDAKAFASFIENQAHLRKLELQSMTLKVDCFYGISKLKRLQHVILTDCRVNEQSCDCLNSLAEVKSIRRLDISVTVQSVDYDDIHLKQLFEFKAPRPNLIEINIRLKYAGALLPGILENCTNLQTLNLTGAGSAFGENLPLKHIFGMSTLRRLTLERCEIKCMSFLDKPGRLDGRVLGDLQNLEYLNLSFNRIKDCIILDHVTKLANLRELDVSGTEITQRGLEQLKNKRNKEQCLQKLQKIKATQCQGIQLTPTEFSQLSYSYKPVVLDVDIDCSGTTKTNPPRFL